MVLLDERETKKKGATAGRFQMERRKIGAGAQKNGKAPICEEK